jgi:hypothetical protein
MAMLNNQMVITCITYNCLTNLRINLSTFGGSVNKKWHPLIMMSNKDKYVCPFAILACQ